MNHAANPNDVRAGNSDTHGVNGIKIRPTVFHEQTESLRSKWCGHHNRKTTVGTRRRLSQFASCCNQEWEKSAMFF